MCADAKFFRRSVPGQVPILGQRNGAMPTVSAGRRQNRPLEPGPRPRKIVERGRIYSMPGWSAGRGPGAGQKNLRSATTIGRSLMLASRRRINPWASNSHSSLP